LRLAKLSEICSVGRGAGGQRRASRRAREVGNRFAESRVHETPEKVQHAERADRGAGYAWGTTPCSAPRWTRARCGGPGPRPAAPVFTADRTGRASCGHLSAPAFRSKAPFQVDAWRRLGPRPTLILQWWTGSDRPTRAPSSPYVLRVFGLLGPDSGCWSRRGRARKGESTSAQDAGGGGRESRVEIEGLERMERGRGETESGCRVGGCAVRVGGGVRAGGSGRGDGRWNDCWGDRAARLPGANQRDSFVTVPYDRGRLVSRGRTREGRRCSRVPATARTVTELTGPAYPGPRRRDEKVLCAPKGAQ